MSAVPDIRAEQPVRRDALVPMLRTLVLCDIADSTALVERLGDLRAAELIRRHDRLARTLLHQFGGREIDKTDGFLVMFDRPIEAVAFALAYQRGLRELAGADGNTPLRARVGVHVGDVVAWDNTPEDIAKGAKPFEVEGLVKPTTSRLMQLALPGQILLSGVAYQLAHRSQDELGDRAATALWRTHGRYRFKGLPDPVAVFEVGEKDIAPLKPPPWSGKAHREVPFWRRPATMIAEVVVLLVLVALPLWYLLRPEPAIAFAQRDWVVVGNLKNLTDDTSFDDSLEIAFRLGLEQSRYVNVLSDLKTRETVKLMQRDPDHTQVDRAIGAEVAIRDGARALILPTVAEIGGRVRVTAEVVDPHTQTTVWSESADGVGAASVLPSLDQVNQKLRVRLGEALATVSSESQPLDKVTTGNLDALRAYSLGRRAHALGNFSEAMAFFRQAVKVDADFALAHAEIGQALSDMGNPAAALAEYRIAASARDRLAPRDALYVEALEASLGPAGTALEKWKQLTALYPDFFPGDGAYAMSLYEQANDYPAAIDAATRSASPKNPHSITSKHLLGILYLGSERYKESADAFAETHTISVTQFRAAPYAVQRDYENAQQTLGDASASFGRRIFEAVIDIDQGRLGASLQRLEKIKADPGRDERRLRAVSASIASLLAPPKSASPGLADYGAIAKKAAAADKDDFDDAQFHALVAAYLAARQGDVPSATSALAAADPKSRDAAGYPVLYRMRRVAEAELARAQAHPDQAIAILKALIDGRELYVTRVALMDAYADVGDLANALDSARWLAAHRGRAFTEYGSEWVLVPFDVAQSNLAVLRAAELELALGQRAQARQDLDAFRRNWGAALHDTPFAARADRVDAATR